MESDWQPIEQILAPNLIGQFMFMGTIQINGPEPVHQYKHRDTRHYLNLNKRGEAFRYDGVGLVPTNLGYAINHALT